MPDQNASTASKAVTASPAITSPAEEPTRLRDEMSLNDLVHGIYKLREASTSLFINVGAFCKKLEQEGPDRKALAEELKSQSLECAKKFEQKFEECRPLVEAVAEREKRVAEQVEQSKHRVQEL